MAEFDFFCASAASPLWYASSACPGPRATAARSLLVEGKTELSDSVALTKRVSLGSIFKSDGRFKKYALIPYLVVPLLPLVVLLVLVLVLVLLVFMMAVSIAVMMHHGTVTWTVRIRTYKA